MEQVLVNGLFLGAQYALIALGLTLIFSLMNVLNFAHGQMYVFGGFITYTVVAQWGMPFLVGLLCSAVTLALIGALIERFLFRPVIQKSHREESTMLLAAGIAFFLDAVILLLFGEKQRGVPKIIDGVFNWDFRIILPYDRLLIGLLAIAMIVVFILYMQHTKPGRAMRALAQDKVAARLDGCRCRSLSNDRFWPGCHAGGFSGRPAGDHHRGQPGDGRAGLDQSLHDDHDWRCRGDLGRHRGGALFWACSKVPG